MASIFEGQRQVALDDEPQKRRRVRKRSAGPEGQLEGQEPLLTPEEAEDLASVQPQAQAAQQDASGQESKAGGLAAGQAAAGGAGTSDVVSTGLIASGNPYAMAAGLALKVLSSSSKRKRAERKQQEDIRVQLKQERIERQQRALQNMVQASQSLRNL